MAFGLPITGGTSFLGRHVELDDPAMFSFTAVVGSDYTTTPSRYVEVFVTGLYTFTMVGPEGTGTAGEEHYLLAGYLHKMRVSKVEAAVGTVKFLY